MGDMSETMGRARSREGERSKRKLDVERLWLDLRADCADL